jgi:hypothetical protein
MDAMHSRRIVVDNHESDGGQSTTSFPALLGGEEGFRRVQPPSALKTVLERHQIQSTAT